MDALILSSTVERTAEKRPRVSWTKRTIPLKSSTLFNKPKHSEEWHQNVEATAGVLHPSDSKFPYGSLINHTNNYLRRKGKITQADSDVRLAILIDSHGERDIGVAAVAHAMSAKSLRALLTADLNVAQGSYWGLQTWLQCLIAANYGNPASVTDLEALWARHLLPYATHGATAAGLYLKGMSRALRKSSIPSLKSLPEFSVLMQRAIMDFSAQLEGMRLRCQWLAAHTAVFWMVELDTSLPSIKPPGDIFLEHIFDTQFPSWRLWAQWRPDIRRINQLTNIDSVDLASIPDLIALEGPDVLTGALNTLKEGLIAQYKAERPWVRFGSLVIEVPDCQKLGLSNTLERLGKELEFISTKRSSEPDWESMFRLFRDLTVAQPITTEGLNLLEAAVRTQHAYDGIDIYDTVRELYLDRKDLGGQHILTLQNLIRVLDEPQAEGLRAIFFHPWLLRGIESCIRDCQAAVRTHIDMSLPWRHLASDLHSFYSTIKVSRYDLLSIAPDIKAQLEKLPSVEQMRMVLHIYGAATAQELQSSKGNFSHEARSMEELQQASYKKCATTDQILPKKPEKVRHSLEYMIEEFCVRRLLEPGLIEPMVQRTIDAILDVWKITAGPPVDTDRRSLALLISKSVSSDCVLRCRCLAEISLANRLLKPATFAKDLLYILKQSENEFERSIIALAQLIAGNKPWMQCWKDLLYSWLEQEHESEAIRNSNMIEYSLKTLKAVEWLSFISCLESIFIELPFSNTEERAIPPILRPQLKSWTTQLSKYTATLTRLEASITNQEALRCILVCSEGLWTKNLLSILEYLQDAEDKPVENLMQKVVGKLSAKTKNAWEVKECLSALSKATTEAIETCEKLWNANCGHMDIPGLPISSKQGDSVVTTKGSLLGKAVPMLVPSFAGPASSSQPTAKSTTSYSTQGQSSDVPLSVVEIMVAGWVQDADADDMVKSAVESLAYVLNLEVYNHTIPTDKLQEATIFWENIEKQIISEADRLHSLQRALKAKDPKGTALLLRELGIPDNSVLDEEIMHLPAGVIDMVERVGDNEIEISFSLIDCTELQRGAMGVPKAANTLLLRLCLDYSRDMPPSFCVHFNNEEDLDTLEHTPWICSPESRSPRESFCKSKQTAFTWQLHRILHTQLKTGNVKIADLHKYVRSRIADLGHSCISCGVSHNATKAHLRRSTPCDIISCAQLWYQLPLDVRIPEIRTDTFAVDIMLTSVYAAAMSGRPELLPGCPFQGNEVIKAILNSLPSLTVISHAVNISTVLKTYHKDAEKLISWACVHFRGYLATPTGICKIPNLPSGTHQFVLVNANPRIENEFVSNLSKLNPKTMVLFHGTSLDRLPAILAQGLKVCSGTSLQRTGAAHGKGIYMAEDPATSFTYSPASLSWRNSGLTNMRLVFGCEVAGSGRSVSSGIHVITDEKSVIVRYAFLFTNYASAPVANHIIPAMMSGMNALRTGAV